MTDPTLYEPSERESPDALGRDDELLSALGRGDRPVGGDPVAMMLAAWRVDLDEPPALPPRAAAPGPETVTLFPVTQTAAPRGQGRAALPSRSVRPHAPSPSAPRGTSTGPVSPDRDAGPSGPGRWRSRRYRLALAAAAVALVAGGAVAAASNATPNSPLWPVSQLLYPQRADRVAAQDALAQARTAAKEGRLADARRLIDQAQALISKVADPVERTRLQDELEQVRQLVSTTEGVIPIPPGSSPAPQPHPSSGPGPTGPSGQPPGPLPSVGLPTDILPTGILPSGLLPTSLLPSLPIIGGH
jgi:hypothetical protein